MNKLKTFKVTTTLEMVMYIDAHDEEGALELAREVYPYDFDTIVDERVEEEDAETGTAEEEE